MILHIVGGDGSTQVTCSVVRFDKVTRGRCPDLAQSQSDAGIDVSDGLVSGVPAAT